MVVLMILMRLCGCLSRIMKITKILTMTIGILSLWSCVSEKKQELPQIKHVVVIGFDGLSPDGLEQANTPNFDKIISEGASTLHARSVLPSSSSTNWASMIMGAGPEQHGITSNSWERNNFVLPAVVQNEDFLFPTIFSVLDDKMPEAEIGAIYHWGGFGRLFEKNAVDYDVNPKTEEETAEVASKYIKEKQPEFTFIHFDHVDHAGHEFGHGTAEYYKSVEKSDELLAQVMEAITSSEMADETVVIISADHGGLGKGHGGETLKEMEIPFIVWGKSVKKNHILNHPVYQYDNAATVAFAFGLKLPLACIGKPVKNAFEGFNETDGYPVVERSKAPIILPEAESFKTAGGLFLDEAEVKIKGTGEIRYTTDGTMPSKTSNKYTAPFKLSKNGVVKSAIFKEGHIISTVNEAFFRVIPSNLKAPITYEVFYLKDLTSVPFLDKKTPSKKGYCFEITSDEVKTHIKPNTAVRFKANIRIEKEDSYSFFTRSDDGSILKINNQVVVNNDGDHGVKENDGKITLKSGVYPLEVVWFNGGGSGWLDVYYQTATMPKQILPTIILE